MDTLTLVELRRLIRAIRRASSGTYQMCLVSVGADPDFHQGSQIIQGPVIPSALQENNGMEPVFITQLIRHISADDAKHKVIECPYHQQIRDLIQTQRMRFVRTCQEAAPGWNTCEEEVPALVRYARNSLTYHWQRGRKWKGDCSLPLSETDFRVHDFRLYVMLSEAVVHAKHKGMPPSEMEQLTDLIDSCIRRVVSETHPNK